MTAHKKCPLSKVTFGNTLTVCNDCIPTHCNTLQHTATHCNTLQHTATHCNTLQHTATHCYKRAFVENDLRKAAFVESNKLKLDLSRLLKIIDLFCKTTIYKRLYSAKETYNFKEPTNRSHPIWIVYILRTTKYAKKRSLHVCKRSLYRRPMFFLRDS